MLNGPSESKQSFQALTNWILVAFFLLLIFNYYKVEDKIVIRKAHIIVQHVIRLKTWMVLLRVRPLIAIHPAILQLAAGPSIMIVLAELLSD